VSLPAVEDGPLTAADLDNDGRMEIVAVPMVGDSSVALAIRGDGSQLEGWPIEIPLLVPNAVTIADLDADGLLEMVTVAGQARPDRRGEVRVFAHDGSERVHLRHQFSITTEASAGVTDLDLDGDLEIMFTGHGYPFDGPGWIYAIHHDGTVFGDSLVLATFEQALVSCPPSFVDMSGGPEPEIAIAGFRGQVYAVDIEGRMLEGWPREIGSDVFRTPIAVGARDGRADGLVAGSDASRATLWWVDGSVAPGWPFYGTNYFRTQPLVADLDGDPEMEIYLGGSYPYNWALEIDATPVDGWPIVTNSSDYGSGELTDLDGDGDTDILFQGYDQKIHVYDTPGLWSVDRIECAAYQYDHWHTGSYEKDLYREMETANRRGGWIVRADTSAWGHRYLVPAPGVEGALRVGPEAPSVAESAPGELFFRTQAPAPMRATLWIRLRLADDAPPARAALEASIDGAALMSPQPQLAPSPGAWLWLAIGSAALDPGVHELRLRVPEGALELHLDRWLLTSREGFPLVRERPHGW